MVALFLLSPATVARDGKERRKDKEKQDAREEPARPVVRCYDVAVRGDLAFLAQTRSFVVVDVSDPTSPRNVGELGLPATATGVALAGDVALLAAESHGLVVADVADPSRPRLIHRFETHGSVHEVAVQEPIAYLADDTGLIVLDAGDPRRPRRSARLSTRNVVRSLATRDDLLATAEGTAGARLFDVTDPEQPERIGELADSEGALDVSVGPGHVVVAAGRKGLLVYAVAGLGPRREATLVATVTGPGAARNVAHEGHLLLASYGSAGLQIVDLSDPRSPRLVASHELPRSYEVGRALLQGDRAFIASDLAGLAILDVSNLAAPTTLFPREKAFRIERP